MTSKSDMVLRPTSEQLCELHVYVVPPSLWQQHLNSAINQVIEETVSAGFVRVHPELNVYSLREEIESQLGFDTVPGDYYFLKCIGRCFTRVKPKQEYQIKVKNFLPPIAYSPEIYLLESTAEIRALFPPSGTSSERSGTASQRNSSVHHHHPNHYQSPHHTHTAHHRRSSTGGSDVNPHRPIPPIRDGATRSSSLRDLATQTGDHPLHADSSRTLHTTSSPHLTSGAGADRLPNGEGEGDDAAVEDGYLPPLSATPPQSPPPAHKPPATPHTYRAADRGGAGEEDEALKRRQLEELKRERDEIDKLSEEIQQKRYIDDQVERKKKELEEIERAQKLTDENNKLTEREKERITAENERQKAEIERQYAEKIRTDEENRRRNEMDEYRRELERELIRRQEERERQRDDLKREQEELERKKQEEEERRKAEKRAEEERTYRELQQQIEDLKRQQQQQQQSAREDAEKIRQSSSSNADDSDNTPGSPKKAALTYREKGQDVENEEATAVDHTQDNEEEQHGDNEATEHEEPVDKEALIERLEQVRAERKEAELRREDLVKRAKQLQNKAQNRRNQARDVWKKKYFEEKKKTPPLEEQSAKLKQELDAQHRKIMSNLEGGRETHRAVDSSKPGPKTNLRIQSTKLEHDIESLKRRLENVKMKLTTEMKLRSQAETELRALRAELTQKKINLTLSRSQQLQVLGGAGGGHPQQDTTRTPIPMYQ